MKVKVKILVDFKSDAEERAIYSSLKPDNTNLPEGLDIKMSIDKRLLIIDFSSISKLETLISTIDDLLICCQASVNTLKEIETIR
jgi:tRNA threonylcarbamoyladenosine modification (KEOPS) complex  Pcc1 subunit